MNDYKESLLTFEAMKGNYEKWNKVLYIGWHPNTFNAWNGDWFIKHINSNRNKKAEIHIIERYIPYFEQLKNHPLTKQYNITCISGDIVDYDISDIYGLIIWWHGPEHVTEEQLNSCFIKFENLNSDILLGGPLGEDHYHEHESGDQHLCILTERLFKNYGYNYKIFDRTYRSNQGPHISAWKIK